MKLLFFPMDGHGHVNSCIGLARMLRDHGHESIFCVPANWSSLITSHLFTVESIIDSANDNPTQDPLDRWAAIIRSVSPSFAKSPLEQIVDLLVMDMKEFAQYAKRINDQFSMVINKVNPDLIFIDFYVTVPAVVNSGKPWVLLYSANPLFAYDSPENPPRYSGYGVSDDPKLFQNFRKVMHQQLAEVKADFNSYLTSKGVTPHPTELVSISPYLNLYSYPEDVDYSELGPVPKTWFRLDHMVREAEDSPIGFDEEFLKTDSKVIFFSLGSMGSADVDLMNRLIGYMSESKHRFIVSKGPYHEEIKLYPNMTGGRYLNQIKILPKVDLVITHGGNNTFVETLYFGKPMIVLPLFNDQHDNARRAIDRKVGKAFGPYQVTKEQLLAGIDEILEDTELLQRVRRIGEKMRASRRHRQCIDKLKELVHNLQESFHNYYVLVQSESPVPPPVPPPAPENL